MEQDQRWCHAEGKEREGGESTVPPSQGNVCRAFCIFERPKWDGGDGGMERVMSLLTSAATGLLTSTTKVKGRVRAS
jgi:hypothetical protein